MPRSFLVKKYFTSKRPNYSELECQNDTLQDSYPLAELPSATSDFPVNCLTAGLVWDVTLLPSLGNPGSLTTLSSSPVPLDLSSPSSVSCSSSGEEDEGRTSDPPSPDSSDTYHPTQQTSRPRRSTKSKGQREDKSETPIAAARPAFYCKHCPKEYNSLGALKMHIRSHTLPCVCPTCGKAFSRPWLLRGHIRTHTGERPFSCTHCNRAFADRSNLRAHLQTHADVKKYQCGTCSRTFSRMSLLQKHSAAGCSPPTA